MNRRQPEDEKGILGRLNPTNLADLIWILDRAGYFFEAQGETTWAGRARQYQKIFEQRTELMTDGPIAELEGLLTGAADALDYQLKFIHEHCCDGYPDCRELIAKLRKAAR